MAARAFVSSDDVPQCPAGGRRARRHRPDGRAEDRAGDHRRLRLGIAHGRHHRGALAGALQGLVSVSGYLITNLEAQQQPLPPKAELGGGINTTSPRTAASWATAKNRYDFNKLIWTTRSPEVALRRCDVRSHGGGLRQPGPRRDRDPQLPLAARASRRAIRSTTVSNSNCSRGRSSPCRRSRSPATSTARLRTVRRIASKFIGQVRAPRSAGHRPQRAAGSTAGVCQGRCRRRRDGDVNSKRRRADGFRHARRLCVDCEAVSLARATWPRWRSAR